MLRDNAREKYIRLVVKRQSLHLVSKRLPQVSTKETLVVLPVRGPTLEPQAEFEIRGFWFSSQPKILPDNPNQSNRQLAQLCPKDPEIGIIPHEDHLLLRL